MLFNIDNSDAENVIYYSNLKFYLEFSQEILMNENELSDYIVSVIPP